MAPEAPLRWYEMTGAELFLPPETVAQARDAGVSVEASFQRFVADGQQPSFEAAVLRDITRAELQSVFDPQLRTSGGPDEAPAIQQRPEELGADLERPGTVDAFDTGDNPESGAPTPPSTEAPVQEVRTSDTVGPGAKSPRAFSCCVSCTR